MSLRKIAQEAGVSISTVSRVINDTSDSRISVETRERVLEIARAMRYRPNPQAVALVKQQGPDALGLVFPYHSHVFRSYYFSEIVCGAMDAANQFGRDIHLLIHREASEDAYRSLFSRVSVAGVLLMGMREGDPAVRICREAGLPVVALSRKPSEAGALSVDCDNTGGAREIVSRLIQHGHKRIGFLSGPPDLPDARDRMLGYQMALQEAGIKFEPRLVVPGSYIISEGRKGTRTLMSLPKPPTAIFGANDQSAIGAVMALKRLGMRVPRDVAVVGFDDIPMAQYVEPSLTTMHQPMYRMGSRAVELLVRHIESPEDQSEPDRLVLRPRLVLRRSCGTNKSRTAAD